jgi:plastocyanin
MNLRPILLLALLLPGFAHAGEVRGVIRYAGAAPAAPARPITRDRPACGASAVDESLLVNDGGLANAVVRIVAPRTPAPVRATLDQQRCRFVPHVQAVPVGSTLEIANGDPVLHGVVAHAGKAIAFDEPMPPSAARRSRTLARPGVVRVGCHVHDWMSAWIVVVDAPAAVSDAAGGFAIADVPAGDHVAVIWHERLGEKVVPVKVPATGTATLEVVYP